MGKHKLIGFMYASCSSITMHFNKTWLNLNIISITLNRRYSESANI